MSAPFTSRLVFTKLRIGDNVVAFGPVGEPHPHPFSQECWVGLIGPDRLRRLPGGVGALAILVRAMHGHPGPDRLVVVTESGARGVITLLRAEVRTRDREDPDGLWVELRVEPAPRALEPEAYRSPYAPPAPRGYLQ